MSRSWPKSTANDSVRLGAMKARISAIGEKQDLMRLSGLLPYDERAVRDGAELREINDVIIALFDRYGLPDVAKRELEEGLEAGLAGRNGPHAVGALSGSSTSGGRGQRKPRRSPWSRPAPCGTASPPLTALCGRRRRPRLELGTWAGPRPSAHASSLAGAAPALARKFRRRRPSERLERWPNSRLLVSERVLLEVREIVLDAEHRPAGAGEDDHRARTPDRVDVRPRPSQLLQVRAGQDGTRRLEKFSGGRLRCHGPILSPLPLCRRPGFQVSCSHNRRFCSHIATRPLPLQQKAPPERGFREVGGTGLEPVTPSLSSEPSSSPG